MMDDDRRGFEPEPHPHFLSEKDEKSLLGKRRQVLISLQRRRVFVD